MHLVNESRLPHHHYSEIAPGSYSLQRSFPNKLHGRWFYYGVFPQGHQKNVQIRVFCLSAISTNSLTRSLSLFLLLMREDVDCMTVPCLCPHVVYINCAHHYNQNLWNPSPLTKVAKLTSQNKNKNNPQNKAKPKSPQITEKAKRIWVTNYVHIPR